jgi:hypothetical protein
MRDQVVPPDVIHMEEHVYRARDAEHPKAKRCGVMVQSPRTSPNMAAGRQPSSKRRSATRASLLAEALPWRAEPLPWRASLLRQALMTLLVLLMTLLLLLQVRC